MGWFSNYVADTGHLEDTVYGYSGGSGETESEAEEWTVSSGLVNWHSPDCDVIKTDWGHVE